MGQVTARLPDELVRSIDEAARRLKRSRAEVIRQAIEYYLDDVEDLKLALETLALLRPPEKSGSVACTPILQSLRP
jgi:RHH-type rel operon transcriptional repressor/antitoxin RelB